MLAERLVFAIWRRAKQAQTTSGPITPSSAVQLAARTPREAKTPSWEPTQESPTADPHHGFRTLLRVMKWQTSANATSSMRAITISACLPMYATSTRASSCRFRIVTTGWFERALLLTMITVPTCQCPYKGCVLTSQVAGCSHPASCRRLSPQFQ
jgi:hypothetical protein